MHIIGFTYYWNNKLQELGLLPMILHALIRPFEKRQGLVRLINFFNGSGTLFLSVDHMANGVTYEETSPSA
jgi:hypothetical protein